MMFNKICISCQLCLTIDKFEHQKNRPNPRKICKLCRSKNRVYSLEQREKSKLYKKKYRLSGKAQNCFEQFKYGITKKELSYKHCCICGSIKKLHIDHCHKNKKFRGLLCNKCNAGIGFFEDNIQKLQNAISYLNHFEKNGSPFRDAPHWELT